ncbi:MAG: hypothetical protein WDN04_07890 [Rhodospirillales bacterium]
MSELAVSATAGFGDTIAGFAAGDVIDLTGMSYTGPSTSYSFNSGQDKLTVSNGTINLTLQLSGSHTASSFMLFNDNGIVGIGHT